MSTNQEIINLFCSEIRKELKCRIKCKFIVRENNNILNIDIYHDTFTFHYTVNSILDIMHKGSLTSKSIVDNIYNEMKACILSKYFY